MNYVSSCGAVLILAESFRMEKPQGLLVDLEKWVDLQLRR